MCACNKGRGSIRAGATRDCTAERMPGTPKNIKRRSSPIPKRIQSHPLKLSRCNDREREHLLYIHIVVKREQEGPSSVISRVALLSLEPSFVNLVRSHVYTPHHSDMRVHLLRRTKSTVLSIRRWMSSKSERAMAKSYVEDAEVTILIDEDIQWRNLANLENLENELREMAMSL